MSISQLDLVFSGSHMHEIYISKGGLCAVSGCVGYATKNNLTQISNNKYYTFVSQISLAFLFIKES